MKKEKIGRRGRVRGKKRESERKKREGGRRRSIREWCVCVCRLGGGGGGGACCCCFCCWWWRIYSNFEQEVHGQVGKFHGHSPLPTTATCTHSLITPISNTSIYLDLCVFRNFKIISRLDFCVSYKCLFTARTFRI